MRPRPPLPPASTPSSPATVRDAAHGPSHYRTDIDGLRGLAVGGVVLFHALPRSLRGGFVGVDVFFVISGFLITGILLDAMARGRFDAIDFYARRARRLFPALALVLTACLAFGWWTLLPADYAKLGLHTGGGAAFLANLFFHAEVGYFDSGAETKPLLHLWSLGIEEQFYLLWPWLLVLALHWRLNAGLCIAAVLLASCGLNLAFVADDPQGTFYLPHTRFWELCIGALLGWGVHVEAPLLRRLGDSRPLRNTLASLGLLLIVGAMFGLHRGKTFPGGWALLPTVGAALAIAAGPQAFVNRRVLSSRGMVWLGAISFPLYLWHWPLLSFAQLISLGELSRADRLACVAAAVLLAWGTWRFVERPIRFGPRGRTAAPWLLGTMVLIGVAGGAVFMADGMPARRVHIDAANRSFVQHYRELHAHGLGRYYREECDFHPWSGGGTRDVIAAACIAAPATPSVMLWGDSHAQALSHGLRTQLPAGTGFSQVASSGCKPSLGAAPPSALRLACDRSNAFAREVLQRTRPDVLLLAQSSDHEKTDWDALAAFARSHGVRRVLLVGPTPQWHPSLPLRVAREFPAHDPPRVKSGLDPTVFATDRVLKARFDSASSLTYVSLVDALCSDAGCLATVPPGGPDALIVVDYGHLSPNGSVFVAQTVLAPALRWRPR